jgi:hypothetical protein
MADCLVLFGRHRWFRCYGLKRARFAFVVLLPGFGAAQLGKPPRKQCRDASPKPWQASRATSGDENPDDAEHDSSDEQTATNAAEGVADLVDWVLFRIGPLHRVGTGFDFWAGLVHWR